MKRYLIMWLLIIQVLSLSNSSLASMPSSTPGLCREDQRLNLLEFKQMFVIDKSLASLCGKYEPSHPKTLSWNESNTNCCTWDGVKCDKLTGDVTWLDLSCSQLSGTFLLNTTLFQLPRLNHLNLAFNDFRHSLIPSSIGMLAPTLTELILSSSSFSGPIPLEMAHLSKLVNLDLSKNGGLLFDFSFNHILMNLTQLESLSLNNLNMSCTIPDSIMNLTSLITLQLKESLLYGEVPNGVFNLPALQNLFISKNYGLIGNFQNVKLTTSLKQLTLSYINFSGGLPESIGHIQSLKALRIEYCSLTGSLTHSIGNLSQLIGLSLRSNSFTGPLPSSICNLSSLMVLDLSKNGFNGTIPPCLGNFSANLTILDLRKNHFHGGLPEVCAEDNNLTILALNENQLQGSIPMSLSHCRRLQVLNLGFNMITGGFPSWLEVLPELKVLVLRSNRFQGSINNSRSQSPFPKLKIFDIYHNMFTGVLPSWYFNNFNAMKNVSEDTSTRSMNLYSSYMNSDMSIGYKYIYSVIITMAKTGRTHLEPVIINRTRIDVSRNMFEGPIPDAVGELIQLKELKMWKNQLTGQIPVSFSKLVLLQSLDLSWNHLSGKIPQELTSLSQLQELNLSFNGLEGRIPQGNPFERFSNSSYMGNKGLWGTPLSRNCQEYEEPTPNDGEDDSYAWMGFTWQVVLMGYAVGVLIGLAVGCVSVYRGRPKWLCSMIDEVGQEILKKYK